MVLQNAGGEARWCEAIVSTLRCRVRRGLQAHSPEGAKDGRRVPQGFDAL
jgi:hypothetical protein